MRCWNTLLGMKKGGRRERGLYFKLRKCQRTFIGTNVVQATPHHNIEALWAGAATMREHNNLFKGATCCRRTQWRPHSQLPARKRRASAQMSIILCYYAVNTFSPHMVISNKCTSTFLENKIFFISPCEHSLYLWIKITHTKSIRVNIICSCQSQPGITFIPTIPFTQGADTTQQGGSVSQPIDWAID